MASGCGGKCLLKAEPLVIKMLGILGKTNAIKNPIAK